MRLKSRNKVTYEVVNRRTTNSLAAFDSKDVATAAMAEYREADPSMAYDLKLVAVNAAGEAIESSTIERAPRAEPSVAP